jgi:UDP-N-acetylmuramoyl-L-alanyl-D-glutamate--2,6-diaminopimelate ligase
METIAVERPVKAAAPWAEPFFTVGITGTNGKTSTTHLVASALAAAGHSVLYQSTLGYYLDGQKLEFERTLQGFLGSLEQAAAGGTRHAAIEVTSLALVNGYAKRWRFDLGVFTNLSRDHVAEHGSWEHYLAAKAQLFLHLGPGRTAVLNACDEAAVMIHRVTPPDVRRVWYGVPTRGPRLHEAALAAREITVTLSGTRVELEPSSMANALGGSLEVRLVGEVFAENGLGAAAAALASGVEGPAVRAGLAACPVPPGRFEVLSRRPLVVVDYAHTPDALGRVCDTARRIVGSGRVLVVFGAGGGYDQPKREPMGEAVGARADLAFVTNDNPRHEDPSVIAEAVANGCRLGGRASVAIVYDRADAIRRALESASESDLVLITGRGHDRGMYFAHGMIPYSDVDTVRQLVGGDGS